MSYCENDRCLTCSDEAIAVKVLSVNEQTGLALVEVSDQVNEVDITLVEEDIAPGDRLLVHGGVAIANLKRESR